MIICVKSSAFKCKMGLTTSRICIRRPINEFYQIKRTDTSWADLHSTNEQEKTHINTVR